MRAMLPRACALVLLLAAACKPSDPKDPATWIARLSDSDPKKRIQAMGELRRLQAKQAAPQIALQLRDPLWRGEAAPARSGGGGPGEGQRLPDAVDTTVGAGSDRAARTAIRTNAHIAEALGEIGDPRAGPTLLRLARSKDDS